MTNQEIALEYLRCFCTGDIDGLEPLLDAKLHFSGTLHTYHSASEYIESLRNDPPEANNYKLISVTENCRHVALFYEYQKPDLTIQIAQLFNIENKKIYDILLIFDASSFV
jgi:hypothetical protein